MLIRSWNVYHGRSHPAGRRGYLEQAVRLATADRPDVLCLQELPLWSIRRLACWSGMQVFAARTRPAPLGMLAGRALTDLHHGLLRSAFSGQANAILVQPQLQAGDLGHVRVSRRGEHARACQAVRVDDRLVVANLHLSGAAAEEETAAALAWLDERLRAGEPLVLAGDFNARLELPGFSAPGAGVDHILVRGAVATPLATWPLEWRRHNGVVLSDHAPVELTLP